MKKILFILISSLIVENGYAIDEKNNEDFGKQHYQMCRELNLGNKESCEKSANKAMKEREEKSRKAMLEQWKEKEATVRLKKRGWE